MGVGKRQKANKRKNKYKTRLGSRSSRKKNRISELLSNIDPANYITEKLTEFNCRDGDAEICSD